MYNSRLKAFLLEVYFAIGFLLFSLVFFNSVVFTHQRTFLAGHDNSIQYYAWLNTVTKAWRNFEIPLWDFSTYSGTSFVGELQTSPFYPPSILLAWLMVPPSPYAIDVYVVLHFALASYLMFKFLRTNGLSPASQVVGAFIYAYVGTIAQKAQGQANIFVGMVYLPVILATFQKSLQSRRRLLLDPWLYLGGIFLGLTILV